MIYFTLILLVQSCSRNYEYFNLYPTNGEYLKYDMSAFFDGDNLNYHYEPIIPNVQITNAFNEITQIQGYEFISISSNQTHFATITKDNHVILYEWKNFIISQSGQVVIIEERYKCYNINLFAGIDVLLDCYAEEHFYLLKLMNTSFNIVYSIQANIPFSSKMQGIYNESKTFLIYAQYYQNISILTLFSSQFKNLTSYQDQFIQIGIPLRENPYIYILFRQSISQFIITQNYTFEQKYSFDYYWQSEVNNFQVYYDYQTLSLCDQIFLLGYDSINEMTVYKYLACNNLFIFNSLWGYSYVFSKKKQQLIQFIVDDEFFLFQQQNSISMYNYYSPTNYILIDKNTQIFFNPYDNYLQCKYIFLLIFIFNKQIIVYQLKIPQLQINLTDQQVQRSTYVITIYAKFFNLTFNGICNMLMSITILDQNDTNIYVQMMLSNLLQYTIKIFIRSEQFFGAYSGKLLSYTVNTNNQQFGQSKIKTFQEICEFKNKQYYLAQLLQTFYGVLYFIGVTKESIQIYDQLFQIDPLNSFMNINITIKVQLLQVAYNIQQHLIIGISEHDKIYIYLIYSQNNQPYFSSSEYKFKQQFSEFLVTCNNLITLFINKEIQIMTLDFTDLVIINETMINTLYNADSSLKFHPIQIAVNTQSLSYCLFINNIYNVIIISIGQNNMPIPISIIEFKFQIKQINIVNQQLVLSYICNQGIDLCFQVWNIQNYQQPFFMKNMMSVHYKNYLQIISDNLFFYVQFSNYTVYVYNPDLPEHMSLYYQLNLSSQLICSVKMDLIALLYYENQINQLSTYQSFDLKVNESLNYSRSYPQMIYNYTVTSLLNLTANYNSIIQNDDNQIIKHNLHQIKA